MSTLIKIGLSFLAVIIGFLAVIVVSFVIGLIGGYMGYVNEVKVFSHTTAFRALTGLIWIGVSSFLIYWIWSRMEITEKRNTLVGV
jgi:hypothetical protein